MIKELYSRNWDYSIYKIDEKLIITVVFFSPTDYFRSFYLLSEEIQKEFESYKDLSEKVRNNYELYKEREITPPITSEEIN